MEQLGYKPEQNIPVDLFKFSLLQHFKDSINLKFQLDKLKLKAENLQMSQQSIKASLSQVNQNLPQGKPIIKTEQIIFINHHKNNQLHSKNKNFKKERHNLIDKRKLTTYYFSIRDEIKIYPNSQEKAQQRIIVC
ncbi:unnamed protein product [Paramecium primaurelia]|uniref:Uncharacterized protein n=1 Tax=Paramecium primaurelia TaxID=5886 RepID=A0A8S1QTM7_PARPR|nr:unnamed protein product [Paramecium primaurelia]